MVICRFSANHLESFFDEIGAESSEFLVNGGNKDIIDYNRLQDEYKVRKGL